MSINGSISGLIDKEQPLTISHCFITVSRGVSTKNRSLSACFSSVICSEGSPSKFLTAKANASAALISSAFFPEAAMLGSDALRQAGATKVERLAYRRVDVNIVFMKEMRCGRNVCRAVAVGRGTLLLLVVERALADLPGLVTANGEMIGLQQRRHSQLRLGQECVGEKRSEVEASIASMLLNRNAGGYLAPKKGFIIHPA